MRLPVEEDWQIALRQQIEQIARRNGEHKKYTQVLDRTQEMDDLVVQLRQLVDTNQSEAACKYVQALSILDETDRLIATKLPETSTAFAQTSQRFEALATKPSWRHSRLNSMKRVNLPNKIYPEKTTKTMRFTTFADAEDGEEKEQNEENLETENNTFIKILHSIFKRWRKGDKNKKLSTQSYSSSTNGNEKFNNESGDDVRDLWKTQFEFFCSILGFMVGVGNFIKFPSLLYQHGGGVFMIPYFVCLVLFGLPFVFLHLCVGQYSGLSASGAFHQLMPIASGIGWSLVILAVPVSIYYNIIVAWSIYYFWFSLRGFFTGGLPWSHCNPDWPSETPCCLLNASPECFSQPNAISAPEAYFHYEVLNRTPKIYPERLYVDNLNDSIYFLNSTMSEAYLDPALGSIQGHLVMALAFAWIFVFFGVFKGVGSIGWSVTITSTLPYFLMLILLIRGLSLPGAEKGLGFLFKPDVDKIWSIPMWKAAAEQVFYSLGIDAGPLISMAGFSRYRNNIYRDAVAVVVLNTFTSVLAGMVIFSFIGFIAHNQGQPVDAILQHDSLYIAFTVYPGVTSFMDMMGPLWAASFFAMLTISAIDAEFAWLEMIISSVMDQFGLKSQKSETRVVVGLCLFCFFCGLPLTARGGIFVFHSVEDLNANWNSFTLSFFQIIVICYVYGVENFIEDVGEMLRVPTSLKDQVQSQNISLKQVGWGKKIKFFFGPTGGYIRWTWCLCSPLFLVFLLVASLVSYQRVTLEDHPLPFRYEMAAWLVMMTPLAAVPIIAIHSIFVAWKEKRSLLSVFDSSKWRHKRDAAINDNMKHKENTEHDYMYIDPLSRVASKHLPNAVRAETPFGMVSVVKDEIDDYSARVELLEKINGWKRRNASARSRAEGVEDCVERASPQHSENGKISSSSSIPSHSPELTLFGPPPENSMLEKTDTVIHRPWKNVCSGNPLNDVETPYNVAQFNLAGPPYLLRTRAASEVSEPSGNCSNIGRDKMHLSNDDVALRNRDIINENNMEDGLEMSTLPSALSSNDRSLPDNQSVGSISITPIGLGRRKTDSSSSVNESNMKPRKKRTALKRPKPIDAPPELH